MPERLNGTVSKTVSRWKSGRGFESLSFRLVCGTALFIYYQSALQHNVIFLLEQSFSFY